MMSIGSTEVAKKYPSYLQMGILSMKVVLREWKNLETQFVQRGRAYDELSPAFKKQALATKAAIGQPKQSRPRIVPTGRSHGALP